MDFVNIKNKTLITTLILYSTLTSIFPSVIFAGKKIFTIKGTFTITEEDSNSTPSATAFASTSYTSAAAASSAAPATSSSSSVAAASAQPQISTKDEAYSQLMITAASDLKMGFDDAEEFAQNIYDSGHCIEIVQEFINTVQEMKDQPNEIGCFRFDLLESHKQITLSKLSPVQKQNFNYLCKEFLQISKNTSKPLTPQKCYHAARKVVAHSNPQASDICLRSFHAACRKNISARTSLKIALQALSILPTLTQPPSPCRDQTPIQEESAAVRPHSSQTVAFEPSEFSSALNEDSFNPPLIEPIPIRPTPQRPLVERIKHK